ncbi:hypothetical protein [Methylobacterium organophilum]|uniref:Phage tail assembly chaperone protein, E, or 41 or 14 n=1 Tax=Methylobacterium organophilum TaxID=410 RepID=A0ABQ4TC94_METOR|nr:hypothetical protein [Methylobacterium organophilum]UMY19135.1 hypothetical protein MMB17_07500 [Methylobacterium organophilum]GJE27947.1 hypothetical protein LKMONMHP_2809 [Methylobacterium organophilum]
MAKTVTVDLERPIEGHEGAIHKVVLREPKWRDIMPIGQPFTMHFPKGASPVLVEDHEALARYAELLVVEPKESSLLDQLGVADTFKIRNQIIGFFLEPAAASGASKTSQQTSSSSSDGPPSTSRA